MRSPKRRRAHDNFFERRQLRVVFVPRFVATCNEHWSHKKKIMCTECWRRDTKRNRGSIAEHLQRSR